MPDRREIGHGEARDLVARVGDRLDTQGQGAAVAVVDAHGELVAFLRTDGCRLPSIGIAINKVGFMTVLCYYGVPYLWTNGWLVYITFMQHHDLRIPYYNEENFNFVRGALCSVDRDYGVANAWVHHINDSHVVHHLFSDMPFYNAIEVTRKYIKPILGEYYASDKRPMAVQTYESWRKCLYVVPSEGITYFRN